MLKFTPNREWIFLLLLGAVCCVLLILQYRWAGALAAAERSQIDLANRNAVETLAKAFDLELQAACEAMLGNLENAIATGGLQQFSFPNHRDGKPLFRSFGIIEAAHDGPSLKVFDRERGEITEDHYSEGWRAFSQGINQPPQAPRMPPPIFMNDFILEFPPKGFPSPPQDSDAALKWILLELDQSYLTETWIPDLVEHYLGDEERRPDLAIWNRFDKKIWGSGRTRIDGPKITVPFNKRGKSGLWKDGPSAEPIWRLEASLPVGAAQKIEAQSRFRNFALGGSAVLLVLLAGLMLSRQTSVLRRMSEERIRFVANVSHEFRTPLTVISGAAFNLKRGIVREGEETREYAAIILDHTEQLGILVSDILDFSGSACRTGNTRLSEIDVAEILNSALDDLAVVLSDMKVEISSTGTPSPVHADPIAIRSIIRNLLDNAAKHARAGAWIGISLDFDSTHVRMAFRDRGPGLSPWDQQRVFDPFYRGRSSERSRGNGLGLSLAREYARAHGGDITLTGRQEEGACFLVTLPLNSR